MLSFNYCILTMEIMELYHKCSSDNDSKICEWQRLLDFSAPLFTIEKGNIKFHQYMSKHT